MGCGEWGFEARLCRASNPAAHDVPIRASDVPVTLENLQCVWVICKPKKPGLGLGIQQPLPCPLAVLGDRRRLAILTGTLLGLKMRV
jgi:hypothetical protein